jgi:hypothetical protein
VSASIAAPWLGLGEGRWRNARRGGPSLVRDIIRPGGKEAHEAWKLRAGCYGIEHVAAQRVDLRAAGWYRRPAGQHPADRGKIAAIDVRTGTSPRNVRVFLTEIAAGVDHAAALLEEGFRLQATDFRRGESFARAGRCFFCA